LGGITGKNFQKFWDFRARFSMPDFNARIQCQNFSAEDVRPGRELEEEEEEAGRAYAARR
jgi:hypothetical protein